MAAVKRVSVFAVTAGVVLLPALEAADGAARYALKLSQIYVKGASWQETMRLSRERLTQAVAEVSREAEAAIRGDDPTYRPMTPVVVQLGHRKTRGIMKVSMAGVKRLYVGSCALVNGERNYMSLRNPRFVRQAGSRSRRISQSPRIGARSPRSRSMGSGPRTGRRGICRSWLRGMREP